MYLCIAISFIDNSGKDLIIDGWFHERGVLWPGQGMLQHFFFFSEIHDLHHI